MITSQFRNFDAPKAPQAVTITWEMVTVSDEYANATGPEGMQDGYWPSQDPTSDGYVGDLSAEDFAKAHAAAQDTLDAFEAGEWEYIGVIARATIHVPIGGGSFTTYTLDSAGLWGTEFNSDPDYLAEIYAEQRRELENDLRAIARHVLADTLGGAAEYVERFAALSEAPTESDCWDVLDALRGTDTKPKD